MFQTTSTCPCRVSDVSDTSEVESDLLSDEPFSDASSRSEEEVVVKKKRARKMKHKKRRVRRMKSGRLMSWCSVHTQGCVWVFSGPGKGKPAKLQNTQKSLLLSFCDHLHNLLV